MPYEESVRAPLIIRHPGIPKPESKVDGLVLSIDLSATVMELAGVQNPGTIQGKSVLPLISGEEEQIRSAGLIEYYSNENPFPWTAQLDYRVVITEQFKYIKWLRFDSAELYDLTNDSYEQHNLIQEPSFNDTVEQMQQELQKLQLEALGLN